MDDSDEGDTAAEHRGNVVRRRRNNKNLLVVAGACVLAFGLALAIPANMPILSFAGLVANPNPSDSQTLDNLDNNVAAADLHPYMASASPHDHSNHLISGSFQGTSHYQLIPEAYAEEIEAQAKAKGTFKHFTLVAGEGTTTLPTGDTIAIFTFNGTYPAPTLRVTQGDVVEITVINPSTNRATHSIDFHGSQLSAVPNFGAIPPGEEKSMTFVAINPGVWAYHCEGTNVFALWSHALRGMVGALIIDPKGGYPELRTNTVVPTDDPTMNTESKEKKFDGPAREFALVFSEWYLRDEATGPQNGTQSHGFDQGKMLDKLPTYAHANGVPFGYAGALFTLPPWDGNNLSDLLTTERLPIGNPDPLFGDLTVPDADGHTPVTHLHVKQGEHVRFFVQNHGDESVAWHIVGEQFDRVTVGGNVLAKGVQTWDIPSYGDATIDVVFEQPGIYAPVNHDYSLLVKGQIMIIEVHPQDAALAPNPSNAISPESDLKDTSISQAACLYGIGPDKMAGTDDDHVFTSECSV
jgi:nitrite reductase (NO-forming)